MNLENFKIKNISETPEEIFRIFLSLVFLTAGLFRIFNPDMAVIEFTALKLPVFLSGFTIFFEIGAGLGLLFNKYVKIIYFLLAGFLTFVLAWALTVGAGEILSSLKDIFIFNLNSTDWLLHGLFLIIIMFLLLKKRADKV